jgi:hypothetical protein
VTPTDPAGGYLHLLPMYLPEGMTITAMQAAMLPWLAPAYSGCVGVTQGDTTPQPVMTVTFEWPISWLPTTQPMGHYDRERLYLRRYSSDQALATGTHAFSNVRPGDDPPDALVDTDAGTLGVESTSLTIESRRGVHALFGDLRQRLLQVDPVRFVKLAGTVVYVWFKSPTDEGLDRPPRRADDEQVQDLLNGLADYEPRHSQLLVPPGPLPQQAPHPNLSETPSGAQFYAVPLQGSAPGSILFTVAGFEVGVAYTTILTAPDAWNEVQRLTDSHDRPGVDLLLISAGAPDQRGHVFPAEEAVASFLVAHPLGLTKAPEHIRRVVLHSWMTGSATELFPLVRHAFGPLYQSMVPVHHPIVPR